MTGEISDQYAVILKRLKEQRMDAMKFFTKRDVEKRLQYYTHKVARCYLDFTGRAYDYYKFEVELNELVKKYLYEEEG